MTRIVACGLWDPDRLSALEPLRQAGCIVEMCEQGLGPLDCVVQQPPDVLLYAEDPQRPWERGALQLVRRAHPQLPVVVVTADGSVEERLLLSEIRPAYVAVDPMEPGELLDAIRALVGRGGRRGTPLPRWRRVTRVANSGPGGHFAG